MTTPETTTAPTTLRLSSPGELVAALPALLGFPPTASLVLLCLTGERAGTLGLVARVDLPPAGDRLAQELVVEQLAVLCTQRDTAAAVLVVVCDEPGAGRAAPRCALVRAVRTALEAVGTELVGAHHVAEIAEGRAWGGYGDDRHGVLGDPRSSSVAAAHVVAGRVLHASRTELASLLDPAQTRAVTRALAPAQRAVAGVPVDELLRRVLTAVARVAHDGAVELTATGVAQLGAALGPVAVRDACFGLAGTAVRDAAEQLWIHLARCLPAPERAAPAVLLAHSAYARAEGPTAGVALETALAADPGHRMAALLQSALRAGLEPASVRALTVTAHGLAAELGVALPPLLAA